MIDGEINNNNNNNNNNSNNNVNDCARKEECACVVVCGARKLAGVHAGGSERRGDEVWH